MDDVADPVLEGVGCGEEEVAVKPDNGDTGRLLVVGVVGDVGRPVCWLTSKQGDIGARGHGDQPEQRECDADRGSSTPGPGLPMAVTAIQNSKR